MKAKIIRQGSAGLKAMFLGAALLISMSMPNSGKAQVLDNKGKDFIMAFMPNLGSPDIELHLTGDVSTMVTIEYPVNSPTFTATVPVTPGNVTILSLPSAAASDWTIGAVDNNGVRAFAPDEFVCYMINRITFTSDAALALPVEVMNTEYIAVSYQGAFHGSDRSEFVVIAGFDNTTVTITPSKNMKGGFSAGVPFSITLDRGEGFLAQSLLDVGPQADLTGTIISADRPVGLSNGNQCGNVPPGNTACDHLFEVAQPVQTWGNEVFVANLPNRPLGSVYRILASLDGTTISMDGTPIATRNRGEFFETGVLAGSHVFTGSNPIFVVQYMTGVTQSGTGTGDPAVGNMIPSEQYLPSYTFSTVGGGQFAENFVTIIAANSDVGSMTLDGSIITAGSFTPIAGTTFSSAVIPLTSGTHTTASTNGHGITVEGVNFADSYIYPGGARFQFINPVGDANPPICAVTISGNTATGSATDNRPSEDTNNNGVLDPGEDLNGNGQIDKDTGIFFVALNAGSSNLQLTVTPFVPGDPVVNYTVSLIDPNLTGTGTVTATDGAGNTCSAPIQLNGGMCDNDKIPPTCVFTPGYKSVTGTFFDNESGIAKIEPLFLFNAKLTVDPFTPGDKQVNFRLDDLGEAEYLGFDIKITDLCGNSFICDPVALELTADRATRPYVFSFRSVDRYFHVKNHGLTEIRVELNGKRFSLQAESHGGVVQSLGVYAMPHEGELTIDLQPYLRQQGDNDIRIDVAGPAGSKADLLLVDNPREVEDMLVLRQVPVTYELLQNYPNPFNPETMIRFNIPAQVTAGTRVKLQIYNAVGELVRMLVDQPLLPGQYTAQWNGRNSDDVPVAAGVYIYRIVAGDYTATKRMLLLK
jgi:hypothetical protein